MQDRVIVNDNEIVIHAPHSTYIVRMSWDGKVFLDELTEYRREKRFSVYGEVVYGTMVREYFETLEAARAHATELEKAVPSAKFTVGEALCDVDEAGEVVKVIEWIDA